MGFVGRFRLVGNDLGGFGSLAMVSYRNGWECCGLGYGCSIGASGEVVATA